MQIQLWGCPGVLGNHRASLDLPLLMFVDDTWGKGLIPHPIEVKSRLREEGTMLRCLTAPPVPLGHLPVCGEPTKPL